MQRNSLPHHLLQPLPCPTTQQRSGVTDKQRKTVEMAPAVLVARAQFMAPVGQTSGLPLEFGHFLLDSRPRMT